MKNIEWDSICQKYASLVINKLQSDELISTFSEYAQFHNDRIQKMPDWQIALPVFACLAAGGSLDDGIILASAWAPFILASEVLDNVEDKELVPDRFLTSPETASNLATGLIFTSFHTLTSIKDAGKARQIVGIFSGLGFDAVHGQHRDLLHTRLPVEEFMNNYWEIIILKSGSIFRVATEGGAVAGGADEKIAEALGDYGVSLGVLLQLMDDCRDAFNDSPEAIKWEISLPLLLYLMMVGEENIIFPDVRSQAEWSDLLKKAGVIEAISSVLLQWKSRALESLRPLGKSKEKLILERFPSLFLKRNLSTTDEVTDEQNG
jgi:hypothetical protein